MAQQTIWYYTNLPKDIIDNIEKVTRENYESALLPSSVGNPASPQESTINKKIRNAKNCWIPTTSWISGFLWHYVQKANRENFLYDLTNIDGETLQYTVYNEGDYYKWHTDSSLPLHYKPILTPENQYNQNVLAQDFLNTQCEVIRKLSFSLQLSDPEDYEGGNFQLMDENGKSYFAPRRRGTMIIFDSRTLHRVLPVKKGTRKSIVGWTVGPRWK